MTSPHKIKGHPPCSTHQEAPPCSYVQTFYWACLSSISLDSTSSPLFTHWKSDLLKSPAFQSYVWSFRLPAPILNCLVSIVSIFRCDPRDLWITKTFLSFMSREQYSFIYEPGTNIGILFHYTTQFITHIVPSVEVRD